MNSNGIYPDGATTLGYALKDKKCLEVLCLKRNDIGIVGLKELSSVIESSKPLRVLDLTGNKLGDEGVSMVFKALEGKAVNNLQALMLAENGITSKGALEIAKLYAKCDTL